MKKKRYMIYSDGSYRDGKGGWSYVHTSNWVDNREKYTIGFGCSHAQSSDQSEIIACIKGLSKDIFR